MTPFRILSAISAFLLLLVILVVAFGSWGTIEAGHRGVVLRMGAVTGEIKPEGFYTKTPWMERVVEMDIRTQKAQDETEAASKDLQTVKATIALNLSVDPSKVAEIYQTVGVHYQGTIVDPALKESLKAVIAQYTAEELISKREVVREAIAALLSSKMSPHGIRTDAMNIVNFDFSHSFNQAIEAKVTAEQNALAAKNKLEQTKFEAQQRIAEAEGKAQAMKVESAVLQTNPQILHLRALEKWDGRLPTYLGSGAIPFIDIKQ